VRHRPDTQGLDLRLQLCCREGSSASCPGSRPDPPSCGSSTPAGS
jgi:hypothetical protein